MPSCSTATVVTSNSNTAVMYLSRGAFAEFVCVPSGNAFAINSSLTDAELACFPCSYSAAENMLHRARVGRGETVLVTGASGGVGSAAVQLACRRGAKVIAIEPVVACTHLLSAIVEAQRDFLSKRHTGKIVLLP
jgi:NADPH:quinone reductase-like Zn-dependent oxidoreductase